MIKRYVILLLCFSLLSLNSVFAEIEVHFLNVGQGDSAIIVCDGEAMIIDGGPVNMSSYVYSYIKNTLQINRIKIMVASHPHEDHIGGLAAVLNAVPVDLILSPVMEWDSFPFSNIKRYADLQATPITVPIDGDEYQLGGATVTVLLCYPEAWSENDMSIVLRVDYGDNSFLFTGDAESMSEYILLDSGMTLQATVLKVGHHGSRTSSTLEFLHAVSPTYAIISCGKNNSYSHPHPETIASLSAIDACILRTDICGEITCYGDGQNLFFVLEQGVVEEFFTSGVEVVDEIPVTFIGDTKSMIFHKDTCTRIFSLFLKNSYTQFSSYEEAIRNGYQPCEECLKFQN